MDDAMLMRCGDCGGWADLPDDEPGLLLGLRAFMARHAGCRFNLTLDVAYPAAGRVPRQRPVEHSGSGRG